MATEVETRKKISALPEVQTLDGFYTVGYKMVDGTPQSKKVNLTYVDTAAQNANTKANLAQEKATLADTKANLADQKASLADEKATLAAQKAALAEQAAGSVDTAKTAAQQAAASANSAASGATAAAAEADEAAVAATEAAAAAVATNTEVTEDEAARVLAETARTSAEASRVSAETARSTAEGQRSSAESTRQTKETERQGSETARGTAEANRATAETARAQAEQARVSAESSRASAETARGTAETERASAETSRASSETSRASAETARASAESSRASAETSRVSAEEARAAAEEDRDEAEESRDTAETARATAESTRVESETARGTAETTRGTNETARQTAETARATAEAARVVAEAARVAEYGQFEFDINEALNAIEGQQDLPVFNNTTAYAAGQYVRYTPVGSDVAYAYRFTTAHLAGPWIGTDAVQTSVFGELKELIIGDEELLHIVVSSSDGLLPVSGIGVNVTFDDGSATLQLTTNASGVASATIAKEKTFNVVPSDQTGYLHIPAQKYKANSNERYVNVVYNQGVSGTSDITVTFSVTGGQQGVAPFVGKNVTLILSNGSAPSALVDSNGVASFSGVSRGLTGYVMLPAISGYGTPSRINFSTDFATIGLTAAYTIVTAGLYMVKQDGTEVDYYAWEEGDTCIALHIATATLIEAGHDYYLKPEHLCLPWLNTTKQWATQNVNFPNVPGDVATDYDGQSNTSNMLTDAATLNIQSPAAEFVTQQTLTINGNTSYGYLGTKKQFQALVDNKTAIYTLVLALGLTPTFFTKNIWVSTQCSAANAWGWYSGSWNNDRFKYISNAVVPFFAI